MAKIEGQRYAVYELNKRGMLLFMCMEFDRCIICGQLRRYNDLFTHLHFCDCCTKQCKPTTMTNNFTNLLMHIIFQATLNLIARSVSQHFLMVPVYAATSLMCTKSITTKPLMIFTLRPKTFVKHI